MKKGGVGYGMCVSWAYMNPWGSEHEHGETVLGYKML